MMPASNSSIMIAFFPSLVRSIWSINDRFDYSKAYIEIQNCNEVQKSRVSSIIYFTRSLIAAGAKAIATQGGLL